MTRSRKCRHPRTHTLAWDLGTWWHSGTEHARQCSDCGAWLSLGPSSDGDERVAVEMRAAHLAHGENNEHEFTQSEWMGWSGDEEYIMCGQHRNVWQDMSEERFAGWEAGGLAVAIATHQGGE